MAKPAIHPWWKTISAMAERLRAHDAFQVDLSARGAVAEKVLEAAEKRIGAKIPARLRALYAEVGDVDFGWRIRAGREHELGLDRSDEPRGRFELVAASKLRSEKASWIRFTNDGNGSGWAFASTGNKVGYYDHDAREVRSVRGSLDATFSEWQKGGFAEPGANEELSERIASGKLVPKAAKAATTSGGAKPRKNGPLIKLRRTYATALAIGRTRAVIAEQTGLLRVLDLATGEIEHELSAGDSLLSLVMIDDDIAITGSMDALEFWRLDTGARIVPKGPFPPRASTLAVVPGTRRVVAGGYTDLVLWDADRAACLGRAEAPTSFVAVSADGVAIALGKQERDGAPALRTWSVGGAKVQAPVTMPKGEWPAAGVVFLTGSRALFPHEKGFAAYDVAKKKWEVKPPKSAVFRIMGASLPNGDVLVTHPSEPKLVRLRASDGATVSEQPLPTAVARSALSVDPTGVSALVAFGDGSVWVVPVPRASDGATDRPASRQSSTTSLV